MNVNVLAVPWRGFQKKTQQNQFVEKFLHNLN